MPLKTLPPSLLQPVITNKLPGLQMYLCLLSAGEMMFMDDQFENIGHRDIIFANLLYETWI